MLSKLMIFFCLFSLMAGAQEQERVKAGFDPVVDVLSEKYEAGPYLIYNCVDKHWVCVLDSYYRDCENQRTNELGSKSKQLSCAPLGVFPTKKSCFERQLYMVGQNFGNKFCIHPDWKQREIEFD